LEVCLDFIAIGVSLSLVNVDFTVKMEAAGEGESASLYFQRRELPELLKAFWTDISDIVP
jgi:hypothetical protein